jgi:hypothetical protein
MSLGNLDDASESININIRDVVITNMVGDRGAILSDSKYLAENLI